MLTLNFTHYWRCIATFQEEVVLFFLYDKLIDELSKGDNISLNYGEVVIFDFLVNQKYHKRSGNQSWGIKFVIEKYDQHFFHWLTFQYKQAISPV